MLRKQLKNSLTMRLKHNWYNYFRQDNKNSQLSKNNVLHMRFYTRLFSVILNNNNVL